MKSKVVIIDTSFMYSYLDKDDLNYAAAKEMLFEYSGYRFIIPSVVVAELIASGDSIDFISYCKIYTSKFINVTNDDLVFMQHIDKEIRRSLKAIDCVILSMCSRYNAHLLTFDQKLEKAYKKLIL